ncbi:transposase family protein [Exiguobacterium alkaliphilum]|uniref:transposase family protein n=2 Tax=Exiguobacterium alkaliphilum TaxID=1428684 RepID=UPI003B84B0D3
MSSDEEPNVFPVIPDRHDIPCPLCQRKTVLHSKRRRRFRHGHAWNVGILWIELDVPRQRCFSCDLTFVYDYGLGLVRTSTEVFRKGIAERCHGRTISDVAREYGLPYTTVERWLDCQHLTRHFLRGLFFCILSVSGNLMSHGF